MHRKLPPSILLPTLVLVASLAGASTIPASTPTATPTVAIGLIGNRDIVGYVYDATGGRGAAIVGAAISFSVSSRFNPAATGSVGTDPSGRFTFRVHLFEGDWITIRINAVTQGYYPALRFFTGLNFVSTGNPIEIALQPNFCPGDCDQNGIVSIDELVLGVAIAGSARAVPSCDAMDANLDATVSIAELVAAVDRALRGCAAPTPTPAPTATPSPALPACGDASLMRRFYSCRQSATEADCAEAGGRWGHYQYSGTLGCFCPTGQDGCACTQSADCLGRCFAPFGNACGTLPQGTCSDEEPQAGCWCEFIDDGHAWHFCNDP